jgi:hypothetical protein
LLVPGVVYTWKQGSKEIMATFQGDRLWQAQAQVQGKFIWQLAQRPIDVPDEKLPVGPSKLTEANFRKLKRGMTKAQVVAIFGQPQSEGAGFAMNWMDAHGNNVQVLYQEDMVVIASAVIGGKNLELNDNPPPGPVRLPPDH